MDRRQFLGTLAGGVLVVPPAARAQPAGRIWRIGVLIYSAISSDPIEAEAQNPIFRAFVRGLRDHGNADGQHFTIEVRGSGGKPERYPDLIAELIRLQVDIIVAVAASQPAVKAATSTIPVVMPGAGDPVAAGFVKSLNRPGTNFTGLTFIPGATLIPKRLDLLKQLVPSASLAAVMWDARFPGAFPTAQAAAQQLGWKALSIPIEDISGAEAAFKVATKARAGVVLAAAAVAFDPLQHVPRVVALAAKYRLPTMYHQRFYADAGGLVSYAADLADVWRRAAGFVDKIMKGAKPADLPVEQPTKIDLVINLKTAKALGLTIPPSVLGRADHLIE
jgi:putative ABC transport system substrate-binding protein